MPPHRIPQDQQVGFVQPPNFVFYDVGDRARVGRMPLFELNIETVR
jgi:hypothetical protein